MHTLSYLFSIYPVQEVLLDNLLPFDIAKLLAVIGCQITPVQREHYMDPVRDVFAEYDDIKLLTKAGARIILLGHGVHLLHQRLNDTETFIKRYGHDFVIDMIAIAYCQPEPSLNAPIGMQIPSLRFTVTDQLLEKLGSRSDLAHSWLESSLDVLPCTDTTLAPLMTPPTSHIRLQQFRLNLQSCWFNTIDFMYPKEALGIFDWSYDEDIIETSVTTIRHTGKRLSLHDTRCYGRWLPPVTTHVGKHERGTPSLTRHRPNTNMHEIMIRLEIPSQKKAGIIRVPTP